MQKHFWTYIEVNLDIFIENLSFFVSESVYFPIFVKEYTQGKHPPNLCLMSYQFIPTYLDIYMYISIYIYTYIYI